MLKNDLKNDIEKTLQAHCPEPPKGFAERMDNKAISLIQKKHAQKTNKGKSRFRLPVLAVAAVLVLCFVTAASRDLIIRPDEIRARETTTPLVTALSEGKGEATEGEGLSQEAIEELESKYPGLINELKPVNLNSEQQGVRFDLISALIKDQDLYMLYTIQDLEGERVGDDLTIFYDDNFSSGDGRQNILRLDYDEANHKGTYLRKCEMNRAARSTDQVRMSFQDLGTSEYFYIDLNPLLERYGKPVEGVALPEDLSVQSDNPGIISDLYSSVLDYTQPLDESLCGPVKLTGIGWIDNKLHVQTHDTEASVTTIGRGSYSSWMISIQAEVTDKDDRRNEDYDTLSWGYTDEGHPVWQEDVLKVSLEEKDQLKLLAHVTHLTNALEATWEFKVPVDSIIADAVSETAAPEEEQAETGALSQKAIETLEVNFPGVADRLKPVNLSCEKQGFRMDVISALVKGNEYWVVYSVKDLEGDRINTFYDPEIFDNLAEDASETDGTSFFCDNPEYGKIYMTHKVFSEPILPEDGKLTLDVRNIPLGSLTELDLIPLLKQYGQNSEGVIPLQAIWLPNLDKVYVDESAKDLGIKVLDYNKPLDLELGENVFLSGIGWIGDQLHVQVQCRENKVYGLTGSPERYGYDRYMVSVVNYPKEGGWSLADEQSPVMWGVNEPASYKSEWKEFVFNSTPADVDRMQLKISISEVTGVVEDNWEIQVPVEQIQAETGEEPQWKATLWAFFTDWVGQDTGYLLDVCADEWKDRQPDPEKAARELMASGKPGGYIINGISGKDNDPVRTVDLTVRWDAGTYNRYEIPFRLQQITPAMEAYRVDPDGFENGTTAEPVPENELVLLTEEEIIRKAISYQEISFDDLIPINLSAEKQGIRMEVISGCVKGQDLYILCSLQDLEGRYDGLDMEIEQWFKPEAPRMGYSRPYSNYAENKSFWLFFIEQFAQYRAEDGTIPFGIDRVNFEKDNSIDLFPLLKEYGKETEGVNAPDNARLLINGTSAEDLKVLDYTNPLDVSLTETAKLAGIGWIDNQLHIQVQTAAETIQTDNSSAYSITNINVYNPFSSQSSQGMQWDDNDDRFPHWYDYVFDIKPENAEQQWICAEVRETKGVVEADWEIPIPVNTLLKGTDEDTVAQDKAAAAAEAWAEYELKGNFGECLLWFFWNWRQGNTDYVTEAFRYEWNTDQADPEESAKEIMKAGTPGGYKIHSVSGKLGDPDCKADVTVLWQEGESSYTCTRHELEFWLQKGENGELEYAINPEGFKNGSANETFPDNPVLMTEEALIQDTMEAHITDVSYDELIPISGLSTEKQGIRMEAVSGCIKGNKAYVLCTLQDVDGKYDGYELDASAERNEDENVSVSCPRVYANKADHKSAWLYEIEQPDLFRAGKDTLTVKMNFINFSDEKRVDLMQWLRACGTNAEGIEPPELHPAFSKAARPGMKVLDYTKPMNIRLIDNVELANIGWIDNQLHVQIHFTAAPVMTGENRGYIGAGANVYNSVADEYPMPVGWDDTGDAFPDWMEFVTEAGPEDLDRMQLTADVFENKGYVEDNWEIQVPVDMLLKESDAEPAAQETEEVKEAEPATLSKEGAAFLELRYPGLLEELKPVNLNCEKEGIRAEVIYALIKDQKLYVVYSLQDLEGDRIKDNLNTYYLDNLGGTGLYSMRLDWDETEEHKATFLKVYDIPEPVQPDGKLVVNLIGLMTEEYTTVDLLPLLKKYGKTVEGVDKPEDIRAETWDWPATSFDNVDLSKYPTILDYIQPLDETLCGPVSLTGIGWIDNKLHVQIHNPDETTCTMGNTTYPSWMGSPRLAITEGEESKTPKYDILSWGAFSNGQTAWKKYAEYVWEITPDDMDHLELKADISHFQKISDATWEIEIPIASILVETENSAADPEATVPAE